MGFKDINKNNNFKDMINQIKSNTDRLRKSPAQMLQDKSHIYCTFYNVNLDHSSVHPGTEDVQEDIGENSPIRYDKIKDCLIFGLEEWNTQKENDDDVGFKIERENTSVIPADTIEPIENSFLKLDLENETILYKVTHVERTMMENIPMYKIEYEAWYTDEEEEFSYIENQIIDEYTMIHEHIGTDKKSLMMNDEIADLEDLRIFIDKLNNLYYRQYYDQRSNTCIFMEGSNLYYSPFVIEFLRLTNTLYDDNHKNKVIVNHELLKDDNFEYYFQNSLYFKIFEGQMTEKEDYHFSMIDIPATSYEYAFSSLAFYIDRNIYTIDKNKVILENFEKIEELKETDEEFEGFTFIIYGHKLTMDTFQDIWTTFKLTDIFTEQSIVDEFLKAYVETGDINWKELDLKYIFNNKSIDFYMKIPLVLFICRTYYNNKIGKSLVGYNDLFNQKLL